MNTIRDLNELLAYIPQSREDYLHFRKRFAQAVKLLALVNRLAKAEHRLSHSRLAPKVKQLTALVQATRTALASMRDADTSGFLLSVYNGGNTRHFLHVSAEWTQNPATRERGIYDGGTAYVILLHAHLRTVKAARPAPKKPIQAAS